jgi:hypothetical protein
MNLNDSLASLAIDRASDRKGTRAEGPEALPLCPECLGACYYAGEACRECRGAGRKRTVEREAFYLERSGDEIVAREVLPDPLDRTRLRPGRVVATPYARSVWKKAGCPPHPVFSPEAYRATHYSSAGLKLPMAKHLCPECGTLKCNCAKPSVVKPAVVAPVVNLAPMDPRGTVCSASNGNEGAKPLESVEEFFDKLARSIRVHAGLKPGTDLEAPSY